MQDDLIPDHLQRLVADVQRRGNELSVTLIFSWGMVTGLLTPIQRYNRWAEELRRRSQLGEGGVTVGGDMRPMSAEEAERVRADWIEHYGSGAETDFKAKHCSMRNVRVYWANGTHKLLDYLLVYLDHIEAFSVGEFGANVEK